MESTSERLKQIMSERGLKQADILRLAEPYCKMYKIKLGKSDLSQFVSGKNAPGQSKLSILGMALDVSEGWLMGLPISRERGAVSDLEKDRFIEWIKNVATKDDLIEVGNVIFSALKDKE